MSGTTLTGHAAACIGGPVAHTPSSSQGCYCAFVPTFVLMVSHAIRIAHIASGDTTTIGTEPQVSVGGKPDACHMPDAQLCIYKYRGSGHSQEDLHTT